MKRLLVVLVGALCLSACNTDGFEELPAVYVDNNGGNGGLTSNPGGSTESNWTYKNVSNDTGIFSATATIYSLNSYKMVDYPSLDGKSFVNIERYRTYPTGVAKRVVIFASSDISCTPSCVVKVRTDKIQEIQMTNSIASAITGINQATNEQLYSIFAAGGTVQVELPLTKEGIWNAQFNARGFDPKQMLLSGEN